MGLELQGLELQGPDSPLELQELEVGSHASY